METRRRGQEFIAGLPGSEKKQQKKQRMLAVVRIADSSAGVAVVNHFSVGGARGA